MYSKQQKETVDYVVKEYNNFAKPVVGHFHNGTGHSMVIASYYDVTVKYQKTKILRCRQKQRDIMQ